MAIPLIPILSSLPGVISGTASLFDKDRRNSEEKYASKEIRNLTDVFKKKLEGNYMDTPEVQRIIAEIAKQQGNQTRQINATAATTGMTDEAQIAYKGKSNEAASNAIGGIAGGADIWRRNTENQYSDGLSTLFDVGQVNRERFNNNISSITQPLQEGIDAGISAGAFDGMSIFGKKKKTA